MKKLVLGLLAVVLVSFTSCEKGLLSKDETYDKENYDKDKYDKKENKLCFGMIYPLSWTLPDGTIATYQDEDAEEVGLKTWYTANPKSTTKPSLNYPVQVKFKDGTIKIIADESTMIMVKKSCEYDKKKENKLCFGMIYPLSWTLPDGTTAIYQDKDAEEVGMKTWYTANPKSTAKPSLNYPVQVKFKDGTIKTITDQLAMIAVKKSCDAKAKIINSKTNVQ